jgi:methylase of polypeptide subunit release factors
MEEVIGAHHEFHDEEFVEGWAARFVPTPKRLELFNVILSELKTQIPANGCVVELGIGPGYLADHLLSAMPDIKFYAIDFSGPMLDIARQRLRPHLTSSFQPGRCMISVVKKTSKESIGGVLKYFTAVGCC